MTMSASPESLPAKPSRRFTPGPGHDPAPTNTPGPGPLPPPGPPISFPDYSGQIHPCLPDVLGRLATLLAQFGASQATIHALTDVGQVRGAIYDELRARLDPKPDDGVDIDIRPHLTDPEVCSVTGVETFGVWIRPPGAGGPSDDGRARDRSLTRINILVPHDDGSATEVPFAFGVGAGFIHRFAQGIFAGQDKRYRIGPMNGQTTLIADPNGPLHLTGLTVNLAPPNQI